MRTTYHVFKRGRRGVQPTLAHCLDKWERLPLWLRESLPAWVICKQVQTWPIEKPGWRIARKVAEISRSQGQTRQFQYAVAIRALIAFYRRLEVSEFNAQQGWLG